MLFKIEDYGITLTKDGAPQITILFKSVESDETKTWWGSLKPGIAREITIKTLMTLGLTKEIEDLADGMASCALNVAQEYELVLEQSEYKGKTTERVRFINIPGSVSKSKMLDADAARIAISALNLKGDLMVMKKHLNVKDQSDVPF